jgi:hypothetical protein
MTTPRSILILSQQPMIAALVAMLVELIGERPVFAESAEPPLDALKRLRPLAVILIDAEMELARSDLLFALAARNEVGVVVFGYGARPRDIGEVASHRSIPWFTLPPKLERLSIAIATASGSEPVARVAERRQAAHAGVALDGTRLFCDASGRNWIVYDRRGSVDRRSSERIVGGSIGDDETARIFVAEDGETRYYALGATESPRSDAAVLEDQLSRAVL